MNHQNGCQGTKVSEPIPTDPNTQYESQNSPPQFSSVLE